VERSRMNPPKVATRSCRPVPGQSLLLWYAIKYADGWMTLRTRSSWWALRWRTVRNNNSARIFRLFSSQRCIPFHLHRYDCHRGEGQQEEGKAVQWEERGLVNSVGAKPQQFI
jgi:hypothetical protein